MSQRPSSVREALSNLVDSGPAPVTRPPPRPTTTTTKDATIAWDASTETTTQRQIALASHDRQRVRQACEGCRTRKVKCDGAETCQRCLSYGVECVYAEFVAPQKNVDATHVEKLESRIASIEQLFRQFLEQFSKNDAGAAATSVVGKPIATEAVGWDPSRTNDEDNIVSEDNDPTWQVDDHNNEDDNSQRGEEAREDNCAEEEPHSKACVYADGFGELDPDTYGELRYVGLGSTASVVDTCVGLRRHIHNGLERKGYEGGDTFLTSPEASSPDAAVMLQETLRRHLPPPILVHFLIDTYVRKLSFLFPILSEADALSWYHEKILNDEMVDDRYASVFFSILAVAAPLVPAGHQIFESIDPKYREASLGAVFYSCAMDFANSSTKAKAERRGRAQDIVIALGLQTVYLAEIGRQAEAWIIIGRAVRLGQDLGLHRSPERLNLPVEERSKRRYIWWCLYILERQLSIALGRPLTIDDTDCDVEIPSNATDGKKAEETAGFVSLIHLHKILGVILKTVSSVKNADSWREVRRYDELRIRVRDSNTALQSWAKNQVPQHIKTANAGRHLAEKQIALSCFFSAVILLHRVFMSNPHRPSPLENSQAQLRCAKAATDCIRGTDDFFRSVPKCHYLVFHGQYVFVSAIVLLQCIRGSSDSSYIDEALKEVDMALKGLLCLEHSWEGAKRCRGIVEEYLEFTLNVLKAGKKGVCHFEHNDTNLVNSDTWKNTSKTKAIRPPSAQPLTSLNSKDAPTRKRKHPVSNVHAQVHARPRAAFRSHDSNLCSAISSALDNEHSTTIDRTGSHQRSKRTKVIQSRPLVEEFATPDTNPNSHFDDVIGDLLGDAPPNESKQQDIFIPGGYDLDFNSAEFSLLCPELWTADSQETTYF